MSSNLNRLESEGGTNLSLRETKIVEYLIGCGSGGATADEMARDVFFIREHNMKQARFRVYNALRRPWWAGIVEKVSPGRYRASC